MALTQPTFFQSHPSLHGWAIESLARPDKTLYSFRTQHELLLCLNNASNSAANPSQRVTAFTLLSFLVVIATIFPSSPPCCPILGRPDQGPQTRFASPTVAKSSLAWVLYYSD